MKNMQQVVVAWYVTNNGGKKFVLQNAFVQYQVTENMCLLTHSYMIFFGRGGGMLGETSIA